VVQASTGLSIKKGTTLFEAAFGAWAVAGSLG
jgi:hypothetical protein